MIARWHIGNVKPHGFECLKLSIESFCKFYDCEIIVCFNCDELIVKEALRDFNLERSAPRFLNQKQFLSSQRKPVGVAWKLYPPRIDISQKELVIDNDIIFESKIDEIDYFINNDCTLMLEDLGRAYGKFDNFVPQNININSGIYGMPVGFNLDKYVEFFAGNQWEINAFGDYKESATFDEQGLIAIALLNYHKYVIVPNSVVSNCENKLTLAKAMHFIGLNRRKFHAPFQEYKFGKKKTFL